MLSSKLAGAALVALLFLRPAGAADLSPNPASTHEPSTYEPLGSFVSGWEIRAGGFASTWGPEKGDPNINAEIVTPKPFHIQGWADYLIPHLQLGGTANIGGGTSYLYAGPMWSVSYDKIFADFALGGAIHDGQIQGPLHEPASQQARMQGALSCELGSRLSAHRKLERDGNLRSHLERQRHVVELRRQSSHKYSRRAPGV